MGWINYLNALPFKTELKKRLPQLEFVTGHPSKINSSLRGGELKLGACSSVNLIGQEKLNIAFPIGLAAKGEVYSVYLGFKESQKKQYDLMIQKTKDLSTELKRLFADEAQLSFDFANRFWKLADSINTVSDHKVPSFVLSKASATSSALSKILYRFMYGKLNYDLYMGRSGARAKSATAIELLIGDEALAKAQNFPYKLDLGSWWADISGLPFVYALWLTSDASLCSSLKNSFLEAATVAQTRMKIEPSDYEDVASIFSSESLDSENKVTMARYWKNLYYLLGPKDFRSLNFYLCLLKDLTTQSVHPSVLNKIDRFAHLPSCSAS